MTKGKGFVPGTSKNDNSEWIRIRNVVNSRTNEFIVMIFTRITVKLNLSCFSSKVKSSKSATSKPAGDAKKSTAHKSGDKEGLLIDFGGEDKKQQGDGAWEADWEDEAWESLNKDD